ncbi:hypothetical protein QAD02_015724 [Eretmocerus hayati]|uniref:Uncharacterized protein n=1 Tax=Eretmocerus hayati TaxID=131215 RepID=A0ACC2P922_9HYME|nr:hypothetical protein QAD02_015724 [Eretmocerus hayati]
MAEENGETFSEEQELIVIHKKERKELQAKIQTLKKSISKGDKKKKREITEEIVRLEADLDKKQDEELAHLKLTQLSIDRVTRVDTDDSELDNKQTDNEISYNEVNRPANRISKAQKRRDKKENAERERNQRIIEQEALNIHGKRNVETQAILNILIQRNLRMHEIPSDGHCLYNAVAHQLKLIGDTPVLGFSDLRKKTAIYLRENSDNFLPFIDNPESDDLLSPEQYQKYCDKVSETNAWGGAIELQVLSCVLKCPIEVIQASGAPYIVGAEYESSRKLVLTYHRHMYQLGAHYNSVTKQISNSEES